MVLIERLVFCKTNPGSEADHSPPSSAEVKNEWNYTSTPQYVFMVWCLVKHRDNFTFMQDERRIQQKVRLYLYKQNKSMLGQC
jgi:hypothetical protein